MFIVNIDTNKSRHKIAIAFIKLRTYIYKY